MLEELGVGGGAQHVPGAGEVGGHDGVEAAGADRLRWGQKLPAAVVHQHVQAPRLAEHGLAAGGDLGAVADVDGLAEDLVSGLLSE